MTDLHLQVGGLLTRNAELRTLLLGYAARLGCLQPEDDDAPVQAFLVPDWVADSRPSAPPGSELFTATVHVSRDAPEPHQRLDAVLDTVHAVLTGVAAGESFSARRLGGPDVPTVGVDTVCRTAAWELTPVAGALGAQPARGAYRDAPPQPGAASSSR